MKIVLREDVESLGRKGDLVDVADGYARNYLVPRGLAMKATKGVRRAGRVDAPQPCRRARCAIAPRPRSWRRGSTPGRSPSGRARARAASSSARSPRPTSSPRCSSATGVEIDRRSVLLDDPIRELGEVEVPVRLHPEVVVPLVVAVVAE